MTAPEPHDDTTSRRSARASGGRAARRAVEPVEPGPRRSSWAPLPDSPAGAATATRRSARGAGSGAGGSGAGGSGTGGSGGAGSGAGGSGAAGSGIGGSGTGGSGIDTGATLIRHARTRRARWIGAVFAGVAASALVFGGTAAMTAAVSGGAVSTSAGSRIAGPAATASPSPSLSEIPTPPPAPEPTASVAAAPAPVDVCAIPAVTAALGTGDDAAVIAAAGGAIAFRDAVASGRAACVPLDDPNHVWVVVNKLRPYSPVDFEPASLALPADVPSIEGGQVRTDAAAALAAMAGAAVAEGAGGIGLESGYRSYSTQRNNYGNGGPDVDASVARPGYSEHQSGLAADVVPCASGCSTMDAFAGTPQGSWVAANAWRFGWIVRYEEGRTAVTGYVPEPWHLRYVGTELAAAYHDGGWHTLEEFFGLAPAPDYAG